MSIEVGPKERAVRATLPNRPAAVLYERDDITRKINHCFAGLFNGARSRGWISPPRAGLFLGKSECEWDWQQVWPAMRNLGLVDYYTQERPAPFTSGIPWRIDFHWWITDKGWDVREDDLRYFRELTAAMDADESERMDA